MPSPADPAALLASSSDALLLRDPLLWQAIKQANPERSGQLFETLTQLLSVLSQRGFELCQLFPVDAPIRDVHPFPLLGVKQPLGVLVANDRRLWPAFEPELGLSEAQHPLDCYVEESVAASLLPLQRDNLSHEVFWGYRMDYAGHGGKPTAVPLQRLAQATGFASLGPAQLCAHPTCGPWFALRAVLILGVETHGLASSKPAIEPCSNCAAPCRAAFEAALDATAKDKRATLSPTHDEKPGVLPTISAGAQPWQPWLAIRDACPIGSDQRYSDAQIVYHYSAAFSSPAFAQLRQRYNAKS